MYKEKKVVALCTAGLEEKFHMKLVKRVIHELQNAGHYVLVFGSDSDLYRMNDSDKGDASIYCLLSFRYIDMVLLFSETIKKDDVLIDIIESASRAKVPVMSIGREMPGCYNVLYDMDSTFEQLVRHIVEYHQMREVNFIAGIKDNAISERRLEIYKKVLDDNDILFEEDRIGYGDFWDGPTREVMAEFMHPSRVPPEAIICANDSMALAVCDYLKEHGVKVPEEMLVVGIDGIEEGIKHAPSITTGVRDEVNDAKKIVDLVNRICSGRKVPELTEFEYHLQLSQSCGCQKHHLFEASAVIAELNTSMAAYRTDIRRYTEMTEKIFKCEGETNFLDILLEYMPDQSFLCLNQDLTIGGESPNMHRYGKEPFTRELNAYVKTDGAVHTSDCYLDNVIPELVKDTASDQAVVMLPVHFIDQVVGYLGLWMDNIDNKMIRTIHFLLSFNNSAGAMLSR